ncbi:biopolymer transporter ExbD [Terrimonas sp. NA20]|uniref:Biopolymer transporter ExbD n=1 Tax=Terrimonas ginsenosidimutans TaxID=2908004 RepID=A0ABS9KVN5_9BACT|nr:biopolymer transporter ExbD [Terrimonas ginsenosidimutans]MCG2616386.1 biopolymer transporter ExbD [Terrimonas ginsenosidimutans]
MASIEGGGDSGGHKKGPGVKKAKRMSTRVDMTPMVDLGFLLITFFIFTATMSSPTTMDLNMPKDTDKQEEETKVKQSGALTIMLGSKDQVYYYEGELLPDGSNFKQTTFKGIRDEIIRKKKAVIAAYTGDAACEQKAREKGKADPRAECQDQDLVIVIKPMEDATYKNTVDILDEMTINAVKRFAMVKISDTERDLVRATEGSAPATK